MAEPRKPQSMESFLAKFMGTKPQPKPKAKSYSDYRKAEKRAQ